MHKPVAGDLLQQACACHDNEIGLKIFFIASNEILNHFIEFLL